MGANIYIEREIVKKGITRLCHFTQSRKLAHIACTEGGVLSTAELTQIAPDLLDVTDKERLDGHLEHISCSIEYPNTWYLNKIKDRDSLFRDWVLLFIKPTLLLDESTLFCCRNASSLRGQLIMGGLEGFETLYKSETTGAYGRNYIRTPEMLECCPTDDQAEVLIHKSIPRTEIIAIGVCSEEQASREISRLSLIREAIPFDWIIVPQLFSNEWSRLVRLGLRPNETLYIKGETEI